MNETSKMTGGQGGQPSTGDVEEKKVCAYQPNKEGQAILSRVMSSYAYGKDKLNTRIPAFSNRTPKEIYKHSLNAYNMVREEVLDMEMNGWKANVKTATTRTKVAAILSSYIKQLMIPSVKANDNSVPKEERAKVGRALLDYWRIKVHYDTRMRETLIDSMASPYTVVELGHRTVNRNVREWNEEKLAYDKKQVPDETKTTFFMNKLKFGQILVSNIQERDIQEQEWVIKRTVQSYEQLEGIYGHLEEWKYVEAGSYFDVSIMDYMEDWQEIKGGMVEEVVYYSITRDEQITIINGIIIEDVPLSKKRIKYDYPFARIGSEPLVDEFSWFSYPLILRLNEDQKLLDHLINIYIDGEFTNIYRPKAVTQDIGPESLIPGTQTVVDEDFKTQDLSGGGSGQIMNIIGLFKNSMEEVSPALLSGVKPEGEMSRQQWVDSRDNAFTSQGIVLAEEKDFVEALTKLGLHDIMQNMLIPAMDKIIGGETPASVIIRNGYQGNSTSDMQILFTDKNATGGDPMTRSFDILKRETETGTKILELEPSVMFTTDFDIFIEPETLQANKEEAEFRTAQMGYNLFMQNPLTNQNFVTEELGKVIYKEKAIHLMKTEEQLTAERQAQQQAEQMEEAPKQLGGEQNQPKIETSVPVI